MGRFGPIAWSTCTFFWCLLVAAAATSPFPPAFVVSSSSSHRCGSLTRGEVTAPSQRPSEDDRTRRALAIERLSLSLSSGGSEESGDSDDVGQTSAINGERIRKRDVLISLAQRAVAPMHRHVTGARADGSERIEGDGRRDDSFSTEGGDGRCQEEEEEGAVEEVDDLAQNGEASGPAKFLQRRGEELNKFSRSITDAATVPFTNSVNSLTGKDKYSFGDLSRHLGKSAVAKLEELVPTLPSLDMPSVEPPSVELPTPSLPCVQLPRLDLPEVTLPSMDLPTVELPSVQIPTVQMNLTALDTVRSELHALSSDMDMAIRSAITEYSDRASVLSRALVSKIASGDYTLADVALLGRVLIALGVDLSPLGTFLPVRVLLELFDYSVALELGDKFIRAVSGEIERRIKEEEEAQNGAADENTTGGGGYVAGDLTKSAILDYTEQESYDFGDVSRKMVLEASPSLLEGFTPSEGSTLTNDSGYSLSSPWKSDDGAIGSKDMLANADILRELEECLAMEKALLERLERMRVTGR